MGWERRPDEQPDAGRTARSSSSTIAQPHSASESEPASEVEKSAGGRLREAWQLGRVFLLLAIVLTLSFAGIQPDNASPRTFGMVALSLALLLLIDRSRTYLVWASYVVGLVLFAHLRVYADNTFIPTRYEYVIELERALFGGHVPTVWLQQQLYQFERATALEIYLMVIYLSYFLVPYAVAAVLWVWQRRYFARYVIATLSTYYLGLLIYVLVPTSPPWLSAEEGYLPHVFRIVRDITYGTNPFIYREGEQIVGRNDVAAMPSLHFAMTVIIMLVIWQYGRGYRITAVLYTISMGLALVYLGEHYVIDLIAGTAVAFVAWWTVTQWLPRTRFPGSMLPRQRPSPSTGDE